MLTVDQRIAFADDAADSASLARLLRTAELAGHDPDHVLRTAVTERLTRALCRCRRSSTDGSSDSSPEAWRRRSRPTPTWCRPCRRPPGGTSWPGTLMRPTLAGGSSASKPPSRLPQWAMETLGPVPAEPTHRLDWEHRAGTVAAWRELAGHTDAADPLGPVSRPSQPEHYAVWRAAWIALGRPEPARADAELSRRPTAGPRPGVPAGDELGSPRTWGSPSPPPPSPPKHAAGMQHPSRRARGRRDRRRRSGAAETRRRRRGRPG